MGASATERPKKPGGTAAKSGSMNPPESLRKAVDHLEQGNWEAAHNIVQSDDSIQACWLHGIVHLLEGDLGNARYWYGLSLIHISEPTRLLSISYAVFCLKKK